MFIRCPHTHTREYTARCVYVGDEMAGWQAGGALSVDMARVAAVSAWSGGNETSRRLYPFKLQYNKHNERTSPFITTSRACPAKRHLWPSKPPPPHTWQRCCFCWVRLYRTRNGAILASLCILDSCIRTTFDRLHMPHRILKCCTAYCTHAVWVISKDMNFAWYKRRTMQHAIMQCLCVWCLMVAYTWYRIDPTDRPAASRFHLHSLS